MNGKDNTYGDNKEYWRKKFGTILRTIFDIYDVSDKNFSEYSDKVLNYAITDSAVRKWFTGKRLPHKSSLQIIVCFLESLNEKQRDKKKENRVYVEVESHFGERYLGVFHRIKNDAKNVNEFIQAVLQYCMKNAKTNVALNNEQEICSTGQTKAVVFDFDGTLTCGKTNRTTWESIWTALGYSVTDCQDLQRKFIRDEITHEEWCQITQEKFVARNLHKAEVENIAKRIKLLPGVRETFAKLEEKNIKIYIVSGSIFDVIKKVLGSSIHHYIDGIKANYFFYNDNGSLSKIVGTKYDFEGKAEFLREISRELQVSTKDILFVGNSFNDRFAYQSGARTLCINPKETDPTDAKVWNYYIKSCKDLTEIMKYISF